MTRRDDQLRRILLEVERGVCASHREMSARVGLSLGLTNQLLRSLLQQGWIDVVHVSAKRRQYVLTPMGTLEQARLARAYRAMAVKYYADIRDAIRRQFEALSREWPSPGGQKRIVLYGSGDLAEIARACAEATDLEVVGVVDDAPTSPAFDGVIVVTCHETAQVRTRLEALGVPAARVRWL